MHCRIILFFLCRKLVHISIVELFHLLYSKFSVILQILDNFLHDITEKLCFSSLTRHVASSSPFESDFFLDTLIQGQKEVSTVRNSKTQEKKGKNKKNSSSWLKTKFSISPRRNPVSLRDWINLHVTLLLRNAARQHGEFRSTSYGRCRARFIVLALRDPQLLECAKKNKIDAPIHTEYFLHWWGKHLDLHCGWRQHRQFFRHVVKGPLEHGRATWQRDMNVHILADVNVTLLNVVERSVVDSAGFKANETGWKNTRATETFGADSDGVSIWEHVGLLLVGTFRSRFGLCVVVQSNVAKFLFLWWSGRAKQRSSDVALVVLIRKKWDWNRKLVHLVVLKKTNERPLNFRMPLFGCVPSSHVASSSPFGSDRSIDLPDKVPSSGIGAASQFQKERCQHCPFKRLFCSSFR